MKNQQAEKSKHKTSCEGNQNQGELNRRIMKRPKVKNKEDLIKKYNKVVRKYRNRGISGPESLAI